jgi:hypothetical protein
MGVPTVFGLVSECQVVTSPLAYKHVKRHPSLSDSESNNLPIMHSDSKRQIPWSINQQATHLERVY